MRNLWTFTLIVLLLGIQVPGRLFANEAEVANLKPAIWLDASSRDFLMFDASEHVSSWLDRSGNHNDAIAATDHDPATWPKYIEHKTVGGANVLQFSSGYLELSKEIASGSFTAFCVVGPRLDDEFGAILGGAQANGGIEFRVGSPELGNVLELNKQNDESILKGKTPLSTTQLSIAGVIFDGDTGPSGAQITFRLNGATDRTGTLHVGFTSGFKLIGFAQATDESFRGYIAEILVFTRALALQDIEKVERYLSAKYKDPIYPQQLVFGKLKSSNSLQPLWKNIGTFLHWDAFPKDYKELLDACVVNGAAAGLIYFLLMLCLYGIAPSKFAAWHEWIANAGIPFSEKIAKTLAPFLLDTSHTLNAVVLRYQARARRLFDDTQEVKYRLKWVPAPLLIDDEPLYNYNRPQTLPSQKPYVAGLLELQARLGVRSEHFASLRSIVSIEGPGGVGKSALAFQIARWASDSRADYRLARFPVLPVLLKSMGSDPKKLNNVDEAAADSMRLIMETSKISAPLLQALLRRKRVLVVVDGVSEMPKEAADLPIRPDKGAADTRFLVVTSRLPTNLLESHVIRPQGLTIEVLDRVLDDLIAANVGSRRFNDTHRETLRMRIRSLIKDAGEGAEERGVPMIFIKLMIERADQLLNEGKQLAELPTTLAELVTKYTEQLLRNEQDLALGVQQARMAAHVCMGKERSPAARSESRYTVQGVSKEVLDKFVTAGLMVGSGDKSDPFYKFALDPIAEQLDANRLMIDIREERAEPAEIDDLIQQWEQLPEDFTCALRRAADDYRDSICATQPALVSKLWPQEIKVNGVV